MRENPFKAYDIRGIYNKDFNGETAYKIGFFLKDLFGADVIAVCRDIRNSSDEIADFLIKGILDSGCDVHNYGYTTTPMSYFISFKKGYKTTVMITASHNPKEYNGFKISGPSASPVGKEAGLSYLEDAVTNKECIVKEKMGEVTEKDIKEEYVSFLKSNLSDISNLNVSIDCSNGSAGLIAKDVFKDANIILDTPDGNFPSHSPNPLEENSRKLIINEVKKNKSDIGLLFDGDADRVAFIDNKGRFISPDLIINILAYCLLNGNDEKVVIDIRSSKSCVEYIKLLGGTPLIWKVGHVFAKAKIKEENAIFGGELAGHYYFKDFGNCDSAFYAAILVLNTLKEWKEDNIYLSDFIDEFANYKSSGELNFKVDNKEKIIETIKEKYKNENYYKYYDFDGIRYDFDDWWFNVRMSNTEPYLRLVLEARNEEILNDKIKEIKNLIKIA